MARATIPILIALLVIAHAVTDFVLQTRRMRREKHRPRVLALHAAHAFLAHALAASLVVPAVPALAAGGVIAGVHVAIDRLKVAWEARHGKSTRALLADQSAHFAVIALAAVALAA